MTFEEFEGYVLATDSNMNGDDSCGLLRWMLLNLERHWIWKIDMREQ